MNRMPARGSSGADWRARTFAVLQRTLLVSACAYLALVVISGHTYLRSYAFGIAGAMALWLILGAAYSSAEKIPAPDLLVIGSIVAWAGWSIASLAWSIHPSYTDNELRSEVGWGIVTAAIFYVVARSAPAFRAVTLTAVAAGTLLSGMAILASISMDSSEAELVLSRSHGGSGAFSTYIVLLAPVLPLVLLSRPAGLGRRWPVKLAVALACVLLTLAARLTENRMLWLALAAGALCATLLATWRWRGALRRSPLRWVAIVTAILLVFAILFVDTIGHRARTESAPDSTIAQTLAEDPRLELWAYTIERIRERPWIGFGFGKSILHDEMKHDLRNPFLVHAHNLFASQWVQTGAVGVAILLALLAALAWRYLLFLRAADNTLAVLGLAGLTLLAAFVVKNMTDDFMVRPTSKEFWALNALLIGWGMRRLRPGAAPA